MYSTHRSQPSVSAFQFVESHGPTTVRLYQVWPGNNRFGLGGRFVFGPDAGSIFLTISLIVTPVILFCSFVSPSLMYEFDNHVGHIVSLVCVIWTINVVILLLITSGNDPGIIPRNARPPEPEDDGSTMSSDWPGNAPGFNLPPTRDLVINGAVVKVKYCQTCMLYRPPRCSHCSICNNCVERFDHHCPWVGQCIGKRNYRFFFMFVSSTTILCLYVFSLCWVNVTKLSDVYKCNVWKALLKSPVSGILILYTFITVWFVGGLTSFHIYLIVTNQTTYENFRYRYDGKTNPYNLGVAHNILEIFFSRIPKSKNNFRAKVKMDPSMFCPSMSLGHTINPGMPRTNFDMEMRKRQAIAVDGLQDMQREVDDTGGLERSGTQTKHPNLDKLEITPDEHTSTVGLELDMIR